MFKMFGVFLAGAILAMLLIAGGVYLTAYVIPQQLDVYFYLVAAIVVGSLVGFVVGCLQRTKAEFLALVCLLPSFILEMWRPVHFGWQRPETLILFLLGQALELSLAFWTARSVSGRRNRTRFAVPN